MPQHGSLTVGSTALPLTAFSQPNKRRGVRLKAAAGNSGTVYVGLVSYVTANSDAGSDGYQLSAKEELLMTPDLVTDLGSIYLIASASSQKVFWLTDTSISVDEQGWALDFSFPEFTSYMPLLF